MKGNRLFFALLKSYLFFAVFVGAVLLVFLALTVDLEQQMIEVNLIQLVLFLLLIGGCSLLYSLWTARRITGPLERLASAIQKMGEGDYRERLNLAAEYEFEVIQRRFNEMAESLERSTEDNRRLEEGKRRMLADLAHDLKTPITTIQGYAKALEVGLFESEGKRELYLQRISAKTGQVTELIDQIFQLSKLDRPDYRLVRERVDAAELLREIVAESYEPFEEQAFHLEVDIPSEEVEADCDPLLMRRALSNLLSNALRHNPPGTQVTVRLQEAEKRLSIWVMDDGVGIADELKETLFEPFVRGDAARADGGSGLGLAIVKQIAELHGGELRLRNATETTAFELVFDRFEAKNTQ
ncbi:HAMP domain-containing sensor histidine kinase [Gorillibacterium sp. CAU 1737]|uniref:HAMP domain-containing sensor histidine kinase n=1 Tax=Gorillibacterium sp. CAU 1737 TaxID=3140362 RepID=UPI0032600964